MPNRWHVRLHNQTSRTASCRIKTFTMAEHLELMTDRLSRKTLTDIAQV
ncbi:MAG: hypothetical protein ACI84K_000912 [Pseudohongiellaceae bacterium]|jgi:hypothetical protein